MDGKAQDVTVVMNSLSLPTLEKAPEDVSFFEGDTSEAAGNLAATLREMGVNAE